MKETKPIEIEMQPNFKDFWRVLFWQSFKKVWFMYCNAREEQGLPETIRAQPRGACPEILAARLRGSFNPFNDPQNPPS